MLVKGIFCYSPHNVLKNYPQQCQKSLMRGKSLSCRLCLGFSAQFMTVTNSFGISPTQVLKVVDL